MTTTTACPLTIAEVFSAFHAYHGPTDEFFRYLGDIRGTDAAQAKVDAAVLVFLSRNGFDTRQLCGRVLDNTSFCELMSALGEEEPSVKGYGCFDMGEML